MYINQPTKLKSIVYNLEIFTKFLDIIIDNNPNFNFRYEMVDDRISVFADILLCSITKINSKVRPHRNWKYCDYIGRIHENVGVISTYRDIMFTIKLRNPENDLDLDAARNYLIEFGNKESAILQQKLFSLGILNQTNFDLSQAHIVFPNIFYQIHLLPKLKDRDNFKTKLQIFISNNRAYVFNIAFGMTVIVINDNQCFIEHNGKNIYDLTLVAATRRNSIIDKKYLLLLFSIFSSELNSDLALLITKLCFDICYNDWNY